MAGEITPVSGKDPTSGDGQDYSDKAKDGLNWLRGKGSDVLQSVEGVFTTVTGKAVLEKVDACIQESEAVNTAMATRIYDLLDRERPLLARLAAVEETSKRHTYWLTAISVFCVASIGLILYLVLHRS